MKKNRDIKKIIISTMPRSGTEFFFEFISRLFGYSKVKPLFTGGYRPKPPEWDTYKFDQTYLHFKEGEVLGSAHYHLNQEIRELLENDEILGIYLYRDPRDVAVSAALYIKYALTDHFLHPLFSRMSDAEAILFYISGGVISAPDLPDDIDVKEVPYVIYEGMEYFCEISYDWLLHSKVAKIRYEDFTRNYGSLSEALKQVGVDVSISKIDKVAREFSFSEAAKGRAIGIEDKTSHYRKGIIGDYQNYFSALHLALCKRRIGEHLIRLGFEKNYIWRHEGREKDRLLPNEDQNAIRSLPEMESIMHQLKEKDHQLSESDRRFQELLNSYSWRVTAPLRKIYDFFVR